MRVERSATITAAPARVFDYVSDLTRHPEWASVAMTLEPLDGGGRSNVGARYRHRARMMGPQEDVVQITAAEPPRRFEFESTGRAGVIRHWFEIAANGSAGSSRVIRGMEVIRPALMTRLMGPVVAIQTGRFFDADLSRIGERLGSQPQAAPEVLPEDGGEKVR